MSSPLELQSDQLTAAAAHLSATDQGRLVAAASRALSPSFMEHLGAEGARLWALLWRDLEETFRGNSGNVRGPVWEEAARALYTTEDGDAYLGADNCFICAQASLDLARGADDERLAGAIWAMLNTSVTYASERLFGCSDVGSESQGELEPRILQEPDVGAALTCVQLAIACLQQDDAVSLDALAAALAPLRGSESTSSQESPR